MILVDAEHLGMVLDIVPLPGTVNFPGTEVTRDNDTTLKIGTSGTLEIVLGTVPGLVQLIDHIVPIPGTVECLTIVAETIDARHKIGTDNLADGLEIGTDVPAGTLLLTDGTIAQTDISLTDATAALTEIDVILTKIGHIQRMVLPIRTKNMITTETVDIKKEILLIILLTNRLTQTVIFRRMKIHLSTLWL